MKLEWDCYIRTGVHVYSQGYDNRCSLMTVKNECKVTMVQSTQMSIPPSVTPALRREALAATVLHPELEAWQGVLVEAWLTFILLCTIQGATNARRKGSVYMPTVVIGSFVTVAVLSGVRQLFHVVFI